MINKADAIQSLRPLAEWVLRGNELEWLDELQDEPTPEAIDAEVIRLQAVYDSLEYARLRKSAYDLLNQDEMRYDDLMNSTTTWQDAIVAIKLEFPK
ncbi:MAG: hypothetical protein ACKVJK_23885 [Methylophagaceae bacterium]